MKHAFRPIASPLAAALAAFLANHEKLAALTAQRDTVRAELEKLESSAVNSEETASQIATKRISLDLFDRDLKRLQAELPELQRVFAQEYHRFRMASGTACAEFRDAVQRAIAEAERKARQPFEEDSSRASAFSLAHADANFTTSDVAVLLKYAPRLLDAWERLTQGGQP